MRDYTRIETVGAHMDDLVIPAQGWRPRKLSEGTSLLIKAVLARSWDQSDLLNLNMGPFRAEVEIEKKDSPIRK